MAGSGDLGPERTSYASLAGRPDLTTPYQRDELAGDMAVHHRPVPTVNPSNRVIGLGERLRSASMFFLLGDSDACVLMTSSERVPQLDSRYEDDHARQRYVATSSLPNL